MSDERDKKDKEGKDKSDEGAQVIELKSVSREKSPSHGVSVGKAFKEQNRDPVVAACGIGLEERYGIFDLATHPEILTGTNKHSRWQKADGA